MNRSLDPPSSSPPSSPPSQSLPSDYTVHTLSPLPHTHGRLDAAAFLRECFQPWAGRRRQEEGDNVQILTVVIKKNTKKKILKKSQFGWIGGVFARAKKQRKKKKHGQSVIADMGRSGTAPFSQLLGECFHCQSFSAGNGVVMLSTEDAAEADARD